MTYAKWLIAIGGISLLVGLPMAFIAAQFGHRVMERVGRAGLAVGLLSPTDRADWLRKENQRRIADRCFYAGLVLIGLGVILQTIGGVL